ncbi:MAG: hypothetical protein EOP04_27395, partial [Proteobacteria bacterium]
MSFSRALSFIFYCLLFLTACSSKNLEWVSSFGGKIQGSVPSFASNTPHAAAACGDRKVAVHKIETDGSYSAQPITSTSEIDSDGNFELSRGAALERVTLDGTNVKY